MPPPMPAAYLPPVAVTVDPEILMVFTSAWKTVAVTAEVEPPDPMPAPPYLPPPPWAVSDPSVEPSPSSEVSCG